jgi:hypothetical protein
LNNNEESLSQSVLEAAVSEIRTLCEREDPELKDKPAMETMDAPLAGVFVDLIWDAAPMSKVNELVKLEVLSWALTTVDKPKLEPRRTFGTIELVEIQELSSCAENPSEERALMRCNPKFAPESDTNWAPLVGKFVVPKVLVWRTTLKDNAKLELAAKTAEETTTLDEIAVPRGTLQTMELSASHSEFSHADALILDDADTPKIPKPTATTTTEEDPVDATFEVPRTNFSGDKYEKDRVKDVTFRPEDIKTGIDANSPWHALETIEVSDIHEWLDGAENPILTDCDRDSWPALEPYNVTDTEPEVGKVRCLRDDIESNEKMASEIEDKEVWESADTRKVTRANPPCDILHLIAESDNHCENWHTVPSRATLAEGFCNEYPDPPDNVINAAPETAKPTDESNVNKGPTLGRS